MTTPSAELIIPHHALETSSGFTWLDNDGIIIAVASSHQLHTLEHAKENTMANAVLAGGVRRPFLIDMNKVKSMSKQAREYYAGPEPKKNITAVGIVTKSSVGKVVANFFLLLTQPLIPTRMFTDFKDAKEWLIQYEDNTKV